MKLDDLIREANDAHYKLTDQEIAIFEANQLIAESNESHYNERVYFLKREDDKTKRYKI